MCLLLVKIQVKSSAKASGRRWLGAFEESASGTTLERCAESSSHPLNPFERRPLCGASRMAFGCPGIAGIKTPQMGLHLEVCHSPWRGPSTEQHAPERSRKERALAKTLRSHCLMVTMGSTPMLLSLASSSCSSHSRMLQPHAAHSHDAPAPSASWQPSHQPSACFCFALQSQAALC